MLNNNPKDNARNTPILLLLIWILSSILLLSYASHKPKTPLLTDSEWTNTDGFMVERPDRLNSYLSQELINQGAIFFINLKLPNWETFEGKIQSAPFTPSENMVIPLKGGIYSRSGYARHFSPFDAHIELSCIPNGNSIKLLTSPSQDWFELPVTLPKNWCPGMAILSASSSNKDVYVGVGTPFKVSKSYTLLAGPLNYFSAYGLSSLIFLLVFLPFLLLNNNSYIKKGAASLLWLGLFGYSSFVMQANNISYKYAFFLSLILLFTPTLILAFNFSKNNFRKIINDLSKLCLIWLILGFFICLPIALMPMNSGAWNFNFAFYPAGWSTDNLLSPAMGAYVFETEHIQPPALGPWSVIDRGFIPAGLVTGQMLVLKSLKILDSVPNLYALSQMITSLANASILLLLIAFTKVRENSLWTTSKICIVLCATPFIFFNIVYAWPKLAAGTYFLWGLLITIKAVETKNVQALWMSFLLFTFGVLFHSGILFLIPGIFVYLLFKSKNITGIARNGLNKSTIAGLLASIILSIFLVLFHNSYGNKTSYGITFFLFGSGQFGLSSIQILAQLRELLQNLSLSSFSAQKLQQIHTLLWPPFPEVFYEKDFFSQLRVAQFYSALPSILLFIPLSIFVAIPKNGALDANESSLLKVILISTISVSLLLILSRFPFIVHHLPYTWLLSIALFAILRVNYNLPIVNGLVLIQLMFFLYVWVWLPSQIWLLGNFAKLNPSAAF